MGKNDIKAGWVIMNTLKIPNSKSNEVIEWCSNNIGERQYYLHNQAGGINWKLFFRNGHSELILDDDFVSVVSFIALKYGTV